MAKRGRPKQAPPTKEEIDTLLHPPGDCGRTPFKELAKPKRGKGRPAVYTYSQDMAERLLYGLTYGLSLTKACRLVGLPIHTMNFWKQRAEQGREPYAEFVRQIDATQTEFELDKLKKLELMSTGQWKGKYNIYGTFLPLERLRQDEFALKGKDTPVNVTLDQRSMIIEAERLANEALERQSQEIREIEATAVESKSINAEEK